jgi:hypothetical protein
MARTADSPRTALSQLTRDNTSILALLSICLKQFLYCLLLSLTSPEQMTLRALAGNCCHIEVYGGKLKDDIEMWGHGAALVTLGIIEDEIQAW